jgi:hypothetical protein
MEQTFELDNSVKLETILDGNGTENWMVSFPSSIVCPPSFHSNQFGRKVKPEAVTPEPTP